MPTILRIQGYRFFFFSNEGFEKPHIHVESGDNYAKFWLNPVALASSFGYNSSEITRLRKLAEKHEKLFLEKWHEYFA
ncbi:MAG: DUF4160 domain-containing protein [Deltaproteobacteria bacterium]|nr:DUF4160 domain-containing protein [Deltaproteobacteria bacterium]